MTPDGTLMAPEQYTQVNIILSKEGNYYSAAVNSDGSFIFRNFIPLGEYLLYTNIAEYTTQIIPYTNSEAIKVNITDRQPVTKNLRLISPTISGKILQNGAVVIPSEENPILLNLNTIDRTTVKSDGSYSFYGNIADGGW